MVAVAAFTSCDNDDDYYYVAGGDAWLSYGNLEAIDNGGYSKYAIRRDDGSRLSVRLEGSSNTCHVVDTYDQFPFAFENCCFHLIDDVL